MKEISNLAGHGIDATCNLLISRRAHLITPTHRLLDAAQESARGATRIGSTLKGIGPAYTDKVAREGLRVGDIEQPGFDRKYVAQRDHHLRLIGFLGFDENAFTIDGLSFSDYESHWLQAAEAMKKLRLVDSEYFLHESLASGKKVLAEGAQGTMLDIDFGSYPYVTSSSTSIGGVCNGLGVNPGNIGRVIGVFKAYCTRVGSGPFPTEQFGVEGTRMREQGREFGSTTGRPRRCGWIDLVALKYAIMINGVTSLFMMKTDVLNDFELILAATAYRMGSEDSGHVPFDFVQQNPEAVYDELPGWNCALDQMGSREQMPAALRDYISYIEKNTDVPLMGISYGPDRNQTLIF
jgi:adenylosuccinate synthase